MVLRDPSCGVLMLLINKHCGAGAVAWPSETKLTFEQVEVAAGDAASGPPVLAAVYEGPSGS
jgi:hypothetical protein